MRIRKSEHDAIALHYIMTEIFSLTISTYVFLCEMAFEQKVLVVMFNTLLMVLYGKLSTDINYENRKQNEINWRDELVIRSALDYIYLRIQNSEQQDIQHLDWQKYTIEAVADIKQCDKDEQILDTLSGLGGPAYKIFKMLLMIFLSIISFCIRGIIAFYIASMSLHFLPALVWKLKGFSLVN